MNQPQPPHAHAADPGKPHPDPQWIFEKDVIDETPKPVPAEDDMNDLHDDGFDSIDLPSPRRRAPMAPRRFEFAKHQDQVPPPAAAPLAAPQRSLCLVYGVAALAASVAGAAAGFVSSQIGPLVSAEATPRPHPSATANTARFLEEIVPDSALTGAARNTVIVKKPVPIATLSVADAAGQPNSQIRLALAAEPAVQGQDLILKMSGIPADAYLTAGRKASDDSWELPHDSLGNVSLVSTGTGDRSFDVTVAGIVPATGELITPIKEFKVEIGGGTQAAPVAARDGTVVTPAAAPAAGWAGPAAGPVPDASGIAITATSRLLRDADDKWTSGRIAEARLAYRQAFSLGSAAGAMGVARSYDPAAIAAAGAAAAEGDAQLAIEWYRRALASGQRAAEAEIRRLKSGI